MGIKTVMQTVAFCQQTIGNYLVKQQDFKYNDGGQGSVFIMTDLGTVLPHYRNIIIQVSCAVIGVLILTSTFYHGLCIVNSSARSVN